MPFLIEKPTRIDQNVSMPEKPSAQWDLVEETPQGNSIVRIGCKHGGKIYRSKNYYLKLYRGGRVTRLRLFPGKVKSAELADNIKNFLRLPGKELPDVMREFFSAPSTASSVPSPLPAAVKYATLGEVLDCHASHLTRLDLKERTATKYRTDLLLVVRHTLAFAEGKQLPAYQRGRKLNLDKYRKMPVDILTAKLARDFKEAFVARVPDGEARSRAKRSANSYLGNAQATFSKKALELYEDEHIHMPDLSGFTSVAPYTNDGKGYTPPGDQVISQIINWANKEDPEREKVLIMALWFGLRREEILEARWGWMTTEGTITVQEADAFIPKSGRKRSIKNKGAWSRLFQLTSPADVVSDQRTLKGNRSQRVATVDRTLSYLRYHGIDDNKPLHALRKLYGCFRATVTGKLWIVQLELGHSSPTVTNEYYATTKIENKELLELWRSRYGEPENSN
jgi:integrase